MFRPPLAGAREPAVRQRWSGSETHAERWQRSLRPIIFERFRFFLKFAPAEFR
ncbi:hypothetical protein FRUB_08407 [Fimbriiglobus ruber]|uniref:Uncharacterized protein n=1 Tax=Fimbriiglobus ruber TaxID=1908690 RepID=A0A225D890_9BACT|nr:hypothetical protein FRUB_08407 [Fimbriiglobus ruber]